MGRVYIKDCNVCGGQHSLGAKKCTPAAKNYTKFIHSERKGDKPGQVRPLYKFRCNFCSKQVPSIQNTHACLGVKQKNIDQQDTIKKPDADTNIQSVTIQADKNKILPKIQLQLEAIQSQLIPKLNIQSQPSLEKQNYTKFVFAKRKGDTQGTSRPLYKYRCNTCSRQQYSVRNSHSCSLNKGKKGQPQLELQLELQPQSQLDPQIQIQAQIHSQIQPQVQIEFQSQQRELNDQINVSELNQMQIKSQILNIEQDQLYSNYDEWEQQQTAVQQFLLKLPGQTIQQKRDNYKTEKITPFFVTSLVTGEQVMLQFSQQQDFEWPHLLKYQEQRKTIWLQKKLKEIVGQQPRENKLLYGEVQIHESKPNAGRLALQKTVQLMTHGFIIRFLSSFVKLYYKGEPVVSIDSTNKQRSFNTETIKRIVTNTTPLAQSFPDGMNKALDNQTFFQVSGTYRKIKNFHSYVVWFRDTVFYNKVPLVMFSAKHCAQQRAILSSYNVLHDRKKHVRIKRTDPKTKKARKTLAQHKWRLKQRSKKSFTRTRQRNTLKAEGMVHRRILVNQKDKIFHRQEIQKKVPSERREKYYQQLKRKIKFDSVMQHILDFYSISQFFLLYKKASIQEGKQFKPFELNEKKYYNMSQYIKISASTIHRFSGQAFSLHRTKLIQRGLQAPPGWDQHRFILEFVQLAGRFNCLNNLNMDIYKSIENDLLIKGFGEKISFTQDEIKQFQIFSILDDRQIKSILKDPNPSQKLESLTKMKKKTRVQQAEHIIQCTACEGIIRPDRKQDIFKCNRCQSMYHHIIQCMPNPYCKGCNLDQPVFQEHGWPHQKQFASLYPYLGQKKGNLPNFGFNTKFYSTLTKEQRPYFKDCFERSIDMLVRHNRIDPSEFSIRKNYFPKNFKFFPAMEREYLKLNSKDQQILKKYETGEYPLPIQIYFDKIGDKGLGIRGTRVVQENQIVGFYAGPIIPAALANAQGLSPWALDYSIGMTLSQSFVICPYKNRWSFGTLFNHSDDPNIRMQYVWSDKGPQAIVLSNRRLAVGESYQWDYNSGNRGNYDTTFNSQTAQQAQPSDRRVNYEQIILQDQLLIRSNDYIQSQKGKKRFQIFKRKIPGLTQAQFLNLQIGMKVMQRSSQKYKQKWVQDAYLKYLNMKPDYLSIEKLSSASSSNSQNSSNPSNSASKQSSIFQISPIKEKTIQQKPNLNLILPNPSTRLTRNQKKKQAKMSKQPVDLISSEVQAHQNPQISLQKITMAQPKANKTKFKKEKEIDQQNSQKPNVARQFLIQLDQRKKYRQQIAQSRLSYEDELRLAFENQIYQEQSELQHKFKRSFAEKCENKTIKVQKKTEQQLWAYILAATRKKAQQLKQKENSLKEQQLRIQDTMQMQLLNNKKIELQELTMTLNNTSTIFKEIDTIKTLIQQSFSNHEFDKVDQLMQRKLFYLGKLKQCKVKLVESKDSKDIEQEQDLSILIAKTKAEQKESKIRQKQVARWSNLRMHGALRYGQKLRSVKIEQNAEPRTIKAPQTIDLEDQINSGLKLVQVSRVEDNLLKNQETTKSNTGNSKIKMLLTQLKGQ